MAMIPARYKGDFPVHLGREHGPRHNGQGKRIDGTLVRPGDIVMMPDTEVLGMTYWHDPARQQPSLLLGAGHVVRPEDAINEATEQPRSRLELQLIGYEFHDGRADFEAVTDTAEASKSSKGSKGSKGVLPGAAPANDGTLPAPATEAPQAMPTVTVTETVPAPIDEDATASADEDESATREAEASLSE